MSLTQAILTSLLEMPCSGAELARRFDKSLGYFWQATHQQIYRELGSMERDGLIAAYGLPTARGRQRHFTVLAPGREMLQVWCSGEGELRPIRDELLLRMRAAAVLGTVDIAAEMRRQQSLHRDVLARYEAIERHDFPLGIQRSTADELQWAVLRAGIVYETSWLAWCEEVLEGPGFQ
ncbi:PadR family transcriptional regulator [Arthrobacter sp. E3]|uniref:PadR family transcriptional regulator n=1 Tax=Arthrobacter sp. E3 TaxID=517402 RepID=UPI001A94E4C3|nr:PadR family transcriptional regulator [Arthrobacter sp. E3]